MQMLVFVGFGFFLSWLKKAGYSSVGFNLFLGAFVLQFGGLVLMIAHWVTDSGNYSMPVKLDLSHFVQAELAMFAVVVSFGALVGKVSPFQLLVLGTLEVIPYAIMESIINLKFKAVDQGGSMLVHVFGCFFGLAVSFMLPQKHRMGASGSSPEENDEDSTYRTDFYSITGTAFMWVFFPSFNGALAEGNAQSRAVVNTILCLAGSCTTTFYASKLLRGRYDQGPACLAAISSGEGKLSMRDIQSATVAGGAAAASVAGQLMQPWVNIALGMLVAFIAVASHIHLQPLLLKYGVHDTTGVLSRHGLPGIVGAIFGIFGAAIVSMNEYGDSITTTFPERANGRSAGIQASMQLAALGVSISVALVGGLFTGALLKLPLFEPMRAPFLDDPFWTIPGEENQYPSSVNKDPDDEREEDFFGEMLGLNDEEVEMEDIARKEKE